MHSSAVLIAREIRQALALPIPRHFTRAHLVLRSSAPSGNPDGARVFRVSNYGWPNLGQLTLVHRDSLRGDCSGECCQDGGRRIEGIDPVEDRQGRVA